MYKKAMVMCRSKHLVSEAQSQVLLFRVDLGSAKGIFIVLLTLFART